MSTVLMLDKVLDNSFANDVAATVSRIWLAGLGAFSKTQEESNRIFSLLVREGEKVESRAKNAADAQIEQAKAKVVDLKSKTEHMLEQAEKTLQERISAYLNKLGVPTNDDIQELTKRVDVLNQNISLLQK